MFQPWTWNSKSDKKEKIHDQISSNDYDEKTPTFPPISVEVLKADWLLADTFIQISLSSGLYLHLQQLDAFNLYTEHTLI